MKKIVAAGFCIAFTAAFGAHRASAQEVPPPPEKSLPVEVKKDQNFDGTVDRIEKFDAGGKITEIIADTTADGKMDNWAYFVDGKIQRAERDTDADGKADTFISYDVRTGEITLIEADSSGDGKINEWLRYRDGRPEKAEKDTNADGKADVWIQY